MYLIQTMKSNLNNSGVAIGVGISIGVSLSVALDNWAFIGTGIAIGYALFITGKRKARKEEIEGNKEQ